MKKIGLLAMLLGGFAACADNQGTPLSVEAALIATAPECVFNPSATVFRTRGTRDVSTNSMGKFGYVMGVRVTNRALTANQQAVRFGPITNVYINENDVTIDGFNLCYEIKNFRNTTEGTSSTPDATYPSCKELATASGTKTYFVGAATQVPSGGGLSAVDVDILPPSVTGIDLTDFKTQSNTFLSGLANTGDRKTVLVHLQAVGHTVASNRLESNEMIFPVELCVGCVPFASVCPGGPGGSDEVLRGITGSTGQVADPQSVCLIGQDEVPTCKTQ